MDVYFYLMPMSPKKSLSVIFRNRFVVHAYLWLFLFIILAVDDIFDPMRLRYALVFVGLTMLPVYTHFLVLQRFLLGKQYILYGALLGLIVAAGGWLDYRALSITANTKGNPLGYMIIVLFMLIVSTAIKFSVRGIRRELDLRELESKQVRTEMALLKSQINPHFMFNTLNNLFALARKQDDSRLADGISRLAHLMRYVIYEADSDQIQLSKEIEQIQSFIQLQRLRYSDEDDVSIKFQVKDETDQIFIAPMLLIPFVENAFKHSASVNRPIRISIRLEIHGQGLHFTVENSINRNRKQEPGTPGLGLANVRRRLELLYPDSHQLLIEDREDNFLVDLKIDTSGDGL